MDIFQIFHPTKIHQNTIESLTKLFKLTEGCPPRPVSKDYLKKKNYFAMENNENQWN